MQQFVGYIIRFIYDITLSVENGLKSLYGSEWVNSKYTSFLNKQIISGDLFNIGLTWNELLLFISTWFIIILFIIFIFKIVFKVIGLFRL